MYTVVYSTLCVLKGLNKYNGLLLLFGEEWERKGEYFPTEASGWQQLPFLRKHKAWGDQWERERERDRASEEGGQRSWHQQLWSDSSAEEVRHFPNRLSEDSRAATGQEGREGPGGRGRFVLSQMDGSKWIWAYLDRAAVHANTVYTCFVLISLQIASPHLSIHL